MQIAFIGNFQPEHSTENELLRAFVNNEQDVQTYQEGDAGALGLLVTNHLLVPIHQHVDFILWVRTGGLAKPLEATYWEILARAKSLGIPVIGYHLDRWWGLMRDREIEFDPYFRVDLLVTADGGHDKEWLDARVNHEWQPPAISARHCLPGNPRSGAPIDIVFTGSWQGGYHREWDHRSDLVHFLQRRYDRRVMFVPARGYPAVRGSALNDLLWRAKVSVGDSCLVPKPDGSPMTHYCSDRIPETLGRGGILLHPEVPGINIGPNAPFDHPAWRLGDWDDLGNSIDEILEWSPDEVLEHRLEAIEKIKSAHTYEARMRWLVDYVGVNFR